MTLADILTAHGISQAQLAAGVLRPDGKPYSVAAINRLIRHHEYPKTAKPALPTLALPLPSPGLPANNLGSTPKCKS